jgi:RHS repeat-associated protein
VLESGTWVKTEEIDYTYDVFNNLIGRQQTTYPSDGPATTVTQWNVFDGTNMVLTFDGSSNLTDRYLWGPMVDQVLADEQFSLNPSGTAYNQLPTAAGNTLWSLGDNQNTVRDVVNDSGVLEEHIAYSPFGRQVAVPSSYSNSVTFVFGYTGAYTDVATADQLHGVRWYDPASQRWLSEDPVAADINLYRYCGNGATNATDPSGLYVAAGHFYTTYLVLVLEGMSPAQAYELAYYSQLPDQLESTDAYELGKALYLKSFLHWMWDYGESEKESDAKQEAWAWDVYNWLHSLHGGDNEAVKARRKCLGRLLGTPNLKPWVKGFLIHALGDAYAHTYDDGKGGRAAYGFASGHAPWSSVDNITNWGEGYLFYIDQLADIFFPNRSHPVYLDEDDMLDNDPLAGLLAIAIGATNGDEAAALRVWADKFKLPATIPNPNGPPTRFVPANHNLDPTMYKPNQAEIQMLIDWMRSSCEKACKKNPQGTNVPPPSGLTN